MNEHAIGFIPPIVGVEEEFNTFRIGGFYQKRLSPGDSVYLLNEKEKIVFGRAMVTNIDGGPLGEMLLIHAHKNHTELANDPISAPERLFATIRKIYGPQIALPNKKTTVIYLKRLE
jgi:hypothetical protein